MTALAERQREARERKAAARVLKAEGLGKLRVLRARLKAALRARSARMKALRETCRAERKALTAHLKAMRESAHREIDDKARYQREAARLAFRQQKEAAKKNANDAVSRARAELAAERQHQLEQRRIAAEHRRQKAEHQKRSLDHTDDEVRAHVPAPLRPLYEAIGAKLKVPPGTTRAEAFMLYAQAHPDEVHALLHPAAEREIQKTQEAIAETAKATERAARAPNAYEVKRAKQIAGKQAKAKRLRAESEAAHAKARAIADVIPLGQPILVGHHSEKRHRRDIKRIQDGFSKSHALSKAAEKLERRARAAETNPAISSDDPDAIEKLKAKLGKLSGARTTMRAVNKALRAGAGVAELVKMGISEAQAKTLMEPDFTGHVGVPAYALQNAAAEAARIEKRIAELEARRKNPPPDAIARKGARVVEEDNRVRIFFADKPPALTRAELKGSGFKFAPTLQAWQRKASRGAWEAARNIVLSPTLFPDE